MFILILWSAFTLAQPGSSNSGENSSIQRVPPSVSEKVYLQLDGKVYIRGNIIWFKSIVLSAHNHFPSPLSGVLYVELVNSNETIVEKKLIKLHNGIGKGFFELSESFNPGIYLIRAYTQWNKNFGPDFYFKEYIQVFADLPGGGDQPINNVKLIKDGPNENLLSVSLHPLEIDTLHKGKLTVLITLDELVDSLELKMDKDNVYRLNYPFSENSRFARLQMHTDNNKIYASTIVLYEEHYDIQFLPESGELVHGLPSKIGFKALDAKGKGKQIAGEIIDELDSVLLSFKSNILGMGSFILDDPDSTKKYYARIKAETAVKNVLLYPLPTVASFGNNLAIEKQDENLLLTARSNYLKNDSIYLNISCRGMTLYVLKMGLLHNGTSKLEIPSEKLPEGIISFTMMDSSFRPVAERIYFNQNPKSRIDINLSFNKPSYQKRDETQITIETTDFNGEPLQCHLSVLAINEEHLGTIQQQRQNILSYFLLDSELKGEIENPGFYFNKDSSRHGHLDALMLTQGWRKYNYSYQVAEVKHLPEASLSVSGNVSSILSKKKKRQPRLTLTTFGNNLSVDVQVADSLGNFTFNLNDKYGKKLDVLIQSSNSSDKKMNYNINLNENVSPEVNFNLAKTTVEPDSFVYDLVRKDLQRKKIEQSFEINDGSILLDELQFAGTRLTAEQEVFREKHGEPDMIIDGKAIVEKEQNWSYGLYSVLEKSFPDKIRIDRASNGVLYARSTNGLTTFIMVDGELVMPNEFALVPNIPSASVASIEVIEHAKEFIDLWCKLYPKHCPRYPKQANIIAIYTHGQKGIYGTQKTPGMLRTTVPVFAAAREFYTPKYNKRNILNESPDLRTLLYWEPELVTNKKGKASTSYYNGDNVGDMMVVVEAVSTNGSIGYQELEYKVEGQETVIVEF